MGKNVYSNLKIVNHPEKLQSFREGKIVAPLYVRIKPTNRCNHACGWCVYQSDFSGMHELAGNTHGWKNMKAEDIDEIPTPKLLEIIADLAEMGVKAVTFSGGGEPLLHPGIVEAMRACLIYGINYGIITNGQALNGARADILASAAWVRVSVDYANAEQMKQSRGTSENAYWQVMENLANFAKKKMSDCELSINFIVTKENHQSLHLAAMMLQSCGVDNIRFSPVWRPDLAAYHAPLVSSVIRQIELIKNTTQSRVTSSGKEPLPPIKIYSSYNLSDPQHGPTRNHHRCYFLQITPSIGADLGVYGCHNVSYSKHGLLGSIKSRSFKNFWFSDEAKTAMEALSPIKSCTHQCAAHSKNDLIQNILDAGDDHFV